MKTNAVRYAFLVLMVFILTMLVSCSNSKSSEEKLEKIPRFVATDFEGKKFTDRDFSKVVGIISFVASWCGPCKVELKQINELAKKYDKLAVLAVTYEPAELMKPVVDSIGVIFPVARVDTSVFEAFGVDRVPARFLVKNGRILAKSFGAPIPQNAEFKKALITALSEKVSQK